VKIRPERASKREEAACEEDAASMQQALSNDDSLRSFLRHLLDEAGACVIGSIFRVDHCITWRFGRDV